MKEFQFVAFRHGRTETVRPLTQEMRVCAQAFYEGKEARQELLKLLQECSKAHTELTKLAAQGKGWDRHLFALKLLAQEEGEQLPNLFVDEAYQEVNQIVLSTSTLSSANFGVGGECSSHFSQLDLMLIFLKVSAQSLPMALVLDTRFEMKSLVHLFPFSSNTTKLAI